MKMEPVSINTLMMPLITPTLINAERNRENTSITGEDAGPLNFEIVGNLGNFAI